MSTFKLTELVFESNPAYTGEAADEDYLFKGELLHLVAHLARVRDWIFHLFRYLLIY